MQQTSLLKKALLIGGTLAICVAVVVISLQLAGYLIDDVLHTEGWFRTVLQFVAVIITLYPMKVVFGLALHSISEKA